MKPARRFVTVILVYVALDLCLASMPGAFVFDAGESVESALMSRTRQVADAVPAPAAPTPAQRDTAIPPDLERSRLATSPVASRRVHPRDEPRVIPAPEPGPAAEDPL